MKGKVSMVKRVAAVCVAMVMGLFGLAMLASPAQADHGTQKIVDSLVYGNDCDGFYVSTDWYGHDQAALYLNGEDEPAAKKGDDFPYIPPATEPGTRVLIEVKGSGGVLHHVEKLYPKACVTPAEPTATALECATSDAPNIAGAIEIPEQEGVEYLINGEAAETGVHDLPPGDYHVTAEAAEGYVLDPDVKHAWDFTIAPINGCPGTPGDDGEPGTPGEPGDDGEDGQDGTVVQEASQKLPNTGNSYLTGLISVGLGLLATGAAAVGFSRFRGVRI